MKVDLFNSFKNPNTCITPTTTTPHQSYTAIWFTTQSTRQDSTRENLKPCGVKLHHQNVICEHILTEYRTMLQVCYFLLYVVAISLIVCQNALCYFVC